MVKTLDRAITMHLYNLYGEKKIKLILNQIDVL